MSDGPVLIGGLAFSGKTPLRIALSAHPRMVLTRGSALWRRHAHRYGDLDRAANLQRCLSALVADPAAAVLAPDRAGIERELAGGARTYARLFAIVHRQHAERMGRPRWGEQMGMLERHADEVLAAWPTAQVIHMLRDPREWHAAAASTHRQLPGRLGREIARWRTSAELATRHLQRHAGRYRVVRFEALRDDPAGTVSAVLRFLHERPHPVAGGPAQPGGVAAVQPGGRVAALGGAEEPPVRVHRGPHTQFRAGHPCAGRRAQASSSRRTRSSWTNTDQVTSVTGRAPLTVTSVSRRV